jgi:hypothetical protein
MNEGLKSAFSTTISSWLSGATSFSDFMGNLFNDILDVWTKMLADMVAKWIASGVMDIIGKIAGISSGGSVAESVAGSVAGSAASSVVGSTSGGAIGSVAGTVGSGLAAIAGAVLPIAAPVVAIAAAIAGIASLFKGRDLTPEEMSRVNSFKDSYGLNALNNLAMKGGGALENLATGRITAAQAYKYSNVGHYAEGGIFNAPTLGIIGEAGPEAVIPLNKMNQGITIEAGAFVINGVNFANEGQKKSVAQEIASYIFDYQNNTRPIVRRAI